MKTTGSEDAVRQWLRASNVRTVIMAVLMSLLVVAPSGVVAGDASRVHDISLAMAAMYVILHLAMFLHARRLSTEPDSDSMRTAAYLLHPCRITSLDLAAWWTAIAVFGPLLSARP